LSEIVAFESVTIDGVTQAPARPDEDARDGFRHGGWAVPYSDESMGRAAAASMATAGAIMLGRRTYEDFFRVWPARKGDPYSRILDESRKYVASSTLREPLPWVNSVLLAGDVFGAVDALRREPGRDIVILGSGELVRSLMGHGLVDRFVLLIHPLVLGSGRRLFGQVEMLARLRLTAAPATDRGVVVATYALER